MAKMGSKIKNIFDVRDYEDICDEYYVPNTGITLILDRIGGLQFNFKREISNEILAMYDAIGEDANNKFNIDLLTNIEKQFYGQPITAKTMHEIGRMIISYCSSQ